MFIHAILTTISLALFLGGFFMIGIDQARPEEKRGGLALIGFVLIMLNLFYLISVIFSEVILAPKA